jgi:hypothetical protein
MGFHAAVPRSIWRAPDGSHGAFGLDGDGASVLWSMSSATTPTKRVLSGSFHDTSRATLVGSTVVIANVENDQLVLHTESDGARVLATDAAEIADVRAMSAGRVAILLARPSRLVVASMEDARLATLDLVDAARVDAPSRELVVLKNDRVVVGTSRRLMAIDLVERDGVVRLIADGRFTSTAHAPVEGLLP